MPYVILSAGRDPDLLKKRNSVLAAHAGGRPLQAGTNHQHTHALDPGGADFGSAEQRQAELDGRAVQCRPERLLQVVTGSLRGGSGMHAA